MRFIRRVGQVLFVGISTLSLGACALAPGMHFSSSEPVDANNTATVPQVIAITPDLVTKQRDERLRVTTEDYNALVAAPAPYRIGPADVLSIIVWDHPELVVPNLTYTIGETGGTLPSGPGLSSQAVPGYVVGYNGDVQFPYIGTFKVGGLTIAEVQRGLKTALRPYIRTPEITVSVVAYRSKRIFVEGAVAQAGIKPITDIPMTLPEALGTANGIPAGVGDTSRVELIRKGKRYRLNIPAMMASGFDVSRILLQDRDVVRVSPQTYNQVFVAGEVNKPTPLQMHDGQLTLSDALANAASVNPTSAEPAAIYVIRATEDPAKPDVFRLDGSSPVGFALAEHFELKPKDVVYVDATGLTRWSRMINLLVPTAVGANASRGVVN
ncbi:polysaccharide biosynthesis/export family protein [Burkholderia sp. PU8-34]